jgi:hypothetical protein
MGYTWEDALDESDLDKRYRLHEEHECGGIEGGCGWCEEEAEAEKEDQL